MLRIQLRRSVNKPSLLNKRFIQTFNALDSDIHITQNGKAVQAEGSGGRSSRSGFTATVFGANGFLGTNLVSKLAKHGTITVVPYREELAKRHLKVCGDLGVVNFVEFDLRNIKSIEDSVKHSDIVFNLIGREYPTKNFTYDQVHVEGAKRIAEAVAKYNVSRFVHVSSHSADINSPSEFLRTKALGEEAVREIIPDTTIVRPAPIFGRLDKFLNPIAASPFMLACNENKERMSPCSVLDVARALEMIGYNDSTAGKTYELYGPKEYAMEEIIQQIRDATFSDITTINIPKKLFKLIADLQQWIYWPTTSPDQVERMFMDQVIDPNAETFEHLGIKPQNLEDNVLSIVRHYRSYLTLRDSAETDKKRRKEREYIRIIH